MKSVEIMEAVVTAIENTIIKEWRHEGFIGGWTSETVNFDIDGKEYVLKLKTVHDGELLSKAGEQE